MKTTLLLFASFLLTNLTSFAQAPVKLSSGQFGFNEGPVWDQNDKIIFSDVGTLKVEVYTISTNSFSTAFTSSVRTNGLMLDENSNLIVCEFQGGKVSQRTMSGTVLNTYATGLTNPNDLCLDKNNGMYVTDPNDDAVYYISPPKPTRTTSLVDDTIDFPNGVLITNDGKKVLVSDSDNYEIFQFDIDAATGALSNKTVFATLEDTDNSEPRSLADGMALDTNGNLYVAAKKSIQIFDASGTHTKTIAFTENVTNCTFGGTNLNTLFVTTPKDLYKIDFTGVTGFQHPFDLPESNLATNDSPFKHSFHIFPNPTSNNKVTITVGDVKINQITLFNNIGLNVDGFNFEKINNDIQVHLNPNLNNGIYILSLKTDDGTIINNKIIIK
ncbi:SMP-30/gluconolactonase/LRE family protein [Tamlana sp. 2_MG-2023]|uniref:SMP-30/gluconolactonase/LRE family protein n=1 Tax=unclassified Tamlana TaxID=2614803 RepID=UPI0026E2C7BE|nr:MULTISPECIES: SMP-30/gluconolactonase/LRE family protein [unclassified Tamlana]MDO6760123.1 SMP-30/gluconolactonase/LRE family protein [Tamlana sp. 2_MG-2023]MDO6790179.1 SMP-30/gluconolactonase/LRE family protein [Tamlana sp. 1_MG-2023]